MHDRRSRVATDYYRRLPDGRLLWGGRASAVEWKSSRLAALLARDMARGMARDTARDMARIHPGLGALKVTSAWSGLMPIARHRMPIIGQLAAWRLAFQALYWRHQFDDWRIARRAQAGAGR